MSIHRNLMNFTLTEKILSLKSFFPRQAVNNTVQIKHSQIFVRIFNVEPVNDIRPNTVITYLAIAHTEVRIT